MSSSEDTTGASAVAPARPEVFARLSARRLLALGGIGLILVGMLLGDIFAVFVLHQNAARVGEGLSAAAHAAIAGNSHAVISRFASVGSFLENRGTKVDAHVHMIAFGYLALILAVLDPWVALRGSTRKKVAWVFLFGACLLPVGVFLIHYLGLAYSPLQAIGWASIFADFGGALVIISTGAWLFGIARHFQQAQGPPLEDVLLKDRSRPGRILFAGGLALVLLGFLHGAYYAAFDLDRHEARDYSLLSEWNTATRTQDATAADAAGEGYGRLAGEKAVKLAAHAHSIEFGLLGMLLAFLQPYVSLRESWKRNWAWVLLLGSLILPVFVLLELRLGLLAGGIADAGGLLVILALLGMWMGIVRHTGEVDAAALSGKRNSR